MKKYIIYKVTNKINNKTYIGLTGDSLNRRKNDHYAKARMNSNSYFHNALIKYEIDNFKWEEFANCYNKENASLTEQYLIKFFNSNNRMLGYNSTSGGEVNYVLVGNGYWKNKKRDRNVIEAMKKGTLLANKKRGCGALKGFKHTEKTRKKMSNSRLGKSPANKNKLMPKNQLEYMKNNIWPKISKSIIAIDLNSGMSLYFRSIKNASLELKIDRSIISKQIKNDTSGNRYKFLLQNP